MEQSNVTECFCLQGDSRIQLGSGLYTKDREFRYYAPDGDIDLGPFIGQTLILQTDDGYIGLRDVQSFWHDGIVALFCDSFHADIYVAGLSPWDSDLVFN
jgi:hypothetical protein